MRKKIHPRVYNAAVGEPFRVEEFADRKIEFYYYEQNPLAKRLLGNQRFYVWTCNGLDYRLFVEEGYYEKVGADLFANKMNEIQIEFMELVYLEQGKTQRQYTWITGAVLAVSLGAAFGLLQVDALGNWGFLIPLIPAFIFMSVFSGRQNKKLRALVSEENAKASEQIKGFLGEDRFEQLLNDQATYIEEFFASDDHEPADNIDEDVEEIEPLGHNPYLDPLPGEESEVVDAEIVEDTNTDA